MTATKSVIYWDSSALLALVFREPHTTRAVKHFRAPARHVLSTLAWAEAWSVLERMARERTHSDDVIAKGRIVFRDAMWEHIDSPPDRTIVVELARTCSLRGADLWHLALVKTLAQELPSLRLLSFDDRLRTAARGEGLALPE